MEALKENLEDMEIGSSVDAFHKYLDSQRQLFHSQVDQLQSIVVTQCKLTGVNPLSQEMAAGAMSIKIGKRPRDLLNPKAIKYMQALFSIKDAISKKECRMISSQFGVTVTQIRDFFASQRTRVRKLVRLSREKAARTNAGIEPQDGVATSTDSILPISLAPLNAVHPDQVPIDSLGYNPVPLITITSDLTPSNSVGHTPFSSNSTGHDSAPLNSIKPPSLEESPSCSNQDDLIPGLDDLDKHFVENIFSLLRKEETFSGQVKLMEWILRIQNPPVLNWFLTKGGVMILATWLSQAATEEQTSVVLVSLKVLCHLPLHKCIPEHMSAILHSVNSLRFYRAADISNRARILLSRWSKMFARIQAIKKPNGIKSSVDSQDMILKRSIDEIMGSELWQSDVNNPENALSLSESSDNIRKMEPPQTLKLLPASTEDSSRKHILGVCSSHTKERRKVQLVEQPGQKTAGRSPQATKPASVSQGRPMSTDDIQKAKMRALFMQSKYGKTGSSSNGPNGIKTEGLNKPANTSSINLFPVPASKVPPRPMIEEQKNPVLVPPKVSSKEGRFDPKDKMDMKEPLGELCRRVQIPWQIPPEIRLNSLWRVGSGENSKEVDVQKNRNRREIETFYRTILEIPSNPKEPWDREMDYDDSLTPDIPIEQPPDTDGSETQLSNNEAAVTPPVVAPSPLPSSIQIGGGSGASEPDLELLAVLLKNPDLVFALTSGQAGNLSTQDTVKLLDIIKRSGTGLGSSVNGVNGKVEDKVEVSLPSPTPSSNPGTSGWRPEVAKNPFSKANRVSNPQLPTNAYSNLLKQQTQTQNHTIDLRTSQQQATLQLLSQQLLAAMPVPQSTPIIPENRQSSMHQSSLMGLHKYSSTTGPSFAMNTPDRQRLSFPTPAATPAPALVHSSRSSSTGNVGSMSDSWRNRQVNSINQTNYEPASYRPVQPQSQSGPPQWGRSGFESWSPDNSPVRPTTEYIAGRNYTEPRVNSGWNYNNSADNRNRQQRNDPGQQRDHNRNGNRRWN